MMRTVCLLCLFMQPVPACAEPVDYLRRVKPLLAARCYTCHGALKQQAGLRLDTAASIKRGGDSGAAVQTGKSGESLLIARVTSADVDFRMPPEGEGSPLNAEEIALLKAWIDQGAGGPAEEKPEADPREHWAFRAPVRPDLRAVGLAPTDPAGVNPASRSLNPIDVFLLAELKQCRLTPLPLADKRILLRRVYLDLAGLPPTEQEIEAFLADNSEDAYVKVVDRLLENPQYGERWGRHWMDIWRYSDWWGLGAEVRNSQKHIWHWRDWIVESLNDDVGYDEMLRQMLAADELYPNDIPKLRAGGFLARQYFKFNRNSWLEETVEHTSKAFLGMTLNCARCHDHKYDPIAQRDYYRFRAFFEPYQVRTEQVAGETDYEKNGIPRGFDCNLDAPTYLFVRGDDKRPKTDEALPPGLPPLLSFEELKIEPVALPVEAYHPELRPWVLENHIQQAERQLAAAKDKLAKTPTMLAEAEVAAASVMIEAVRARGAADRARWQQPVAENVAEFVRAAAKAEKELAHKQSQVSVAQIELELLSVDPAKKAELEKKLTAAREAAEKAAKALEAPGETHTPLSGALKTVESNVEPPEHYKRPFPETSTGRRTALARWMTDRRHPTVARVAVNHIWLRHMGAPLVPTVFDLGRKGSPPTHPQLLDWLAVELMENNWSMKHLHRLIVTSEAYRRTSSACGSEANFKTDPENRYYWRMNPTRLESQVLRDALLHLAGDLDLARGGPSIPVAQTESSKRRSLYFVHSHNEHARWLSMFDDANVLDCYRRDQSIVPQQALTLANSRLSIDSAEKIAHRTGILPAGAKELDDATFIRRAYSLLLASEPSDEELAACLDALGQWKSQGLAIDRARANLVLSLINHNDFVTVR